MTERAPTTFAAPVFTTRCPIATPPNDEVVTMTEPTTTDAPTPAPTQGKPPSRVIVRWKGEGTMAFEGGKAKGGPTITAGM